MARRRRNAIYGHMTNMAMRRKLVLKKAIDVSACAREVDAYILRKFVEGMDYCDAETEQWIWSIGRRKEDGAILARADTGCYQNDLFECLWLR